MAKIKKMAFGGMGQPATAQPNPARAPSGLPQGMTGGVPQPQQKGVGLPLDASKMAAEAAAQQRAEAAAQQRSGGMGRGMGFRGDMRGQTPPQQAPVGLGTGIGAVQGMDKAAIEAMVQKARANAPGGVSQRATQAPAGTPPRATFVNDPAETQKMQSGPQAVPVAKPTGMGSVPSQAAQRYMKSLGALGGAPSAMMKKGGAVKKKAAPVKKMASGGMTSSASRRGDGIASKGKTKGTMVKMSMGGKACK